MIYNEGKPCFCSIGAGGKPCIDRPFCDKNKNMMWEKRENEREACTGKRDRFEESI